MVDTWRDVRPERLLEAQFHITGNFHPGQREIIELLMQGKRVLAIQRTGWGKSLCYQMASLYYPHLTLANFPLMQLAQRTRDAVARFLNKEWLPLIQTINKELF